MGARSMETASSPAATRIGVGVRVGGWLLVAFTSRGIDSTADRADRSSASPSRTSKDTELFPEYSAETCREMRVRSTTSAPASMPTEVRSVEASTMRGVRPARVMTWSAMSMTTSCPARTWRGSVESSSRGRACPVPGTETTAEALSPSASVTVYTTMRRCSVGVTIRSPPDTVAAPSRVDTTSSDTSPSGSSSLASTSTRTGEPSVGTSPSATTSSRARGGCRGGVRGDIDGECAVRVAAAPVGDPVGEQVGARPTR